MSLLAVSSAVWLAIAVFGLILATAWIILPFALIGTKPLLRQLMAEVQRTNALLQAHRSSGASD